MTQSNKDLARIDYLHGMKYRELADKYGVSLSTVKSWKVRYKWERKSMQKDKKVRTKAQKGTQTKNSTQEKQKVINDIDKKIEEDHNQKLEREIDKMLVNDQLNDKQKLFCIYYIKCFNATKAYKKAYECDYISAMTNGSRLLSNDKIRDEIQRLKADKFKGAMLSIQDLLQKYIDIALSDMNDYMEYGHKKIPVIDKETGKQKLDQDGNPRYYINNYVILNDSSEVDGTLVTEVSEGKDGIKLKLMDKKFALEFLAKYQGLLDKPTQAKLDIERRKMEIAEKQADTLDKDIEYEVEGGSDEDKEED